MDGLLISAVSPGSIAEELEIAPGDRLVAIDGHRLRDIIDYNYFGDGDHLLLEILKEDDEIWEMDVEREPGEPLGLIFAPPAPAKCGNRCVFCFVHQLPKGLRAPLYVKDEDYRLSFLYGNYVTLANLDSTDLARIKEQRLSPLYVSVHATDPAVREHLLGKKGIRPILEVMAELAGARITMHAQVVLCPGLNDGPILEKTVADLVALHPLVASLAIVPVGLTRHRRGLPKLQSVTSEYAADFVKEWQPRADAIAERLGEPFLFLADEFFLKAGLPFPPVEAYGDFPQLENGVGMIPLFQEEAQEMLDAAESLSPLHATVVSGLSPLPYLSAFLRSLADKTGATLDLVPVENRFFGESVTVTGLVTGQDVMSALERRDNGSLVVIPDVMLKEGEGVFLDDLPVHELEDVLKVRVVVAEATPAGLYRALRSSCPSDGRL